MTTGAAVLVGGTLCVPPELLAALHAELIAPRQQVPLDVVQPHRSPQMAALTDTVLAGAIAHKQATRESPCAFPALSQTQAVTPWEASAQVDGPSEDGEAVSVAVVSGMLGFSPQWVRVLASSGALPGARKFRSHSGNGRGTARIRWCIPLASVHAYLRDRQVAR
jgi:hypothetical protein